MANYDIVGSIAILKTEGMNRKQVSKQARQLIKRPNIKTVVEKIERFKGRLRRIKVKHLVGDKNLISIHKESGCLFELDIEECYFSSRLSNDRLEMAKKVKKKDNVLCMFSGVGPYPIVIAKISNPKKITCVELGRECNKYAKKNVELNKINNIEILQGDVKKVIPKLKKKKEKYDVIVMTRPNLKDSFFKEALSVSKKGTLILYHGFSKKDELEGLLEGLKEEAKENKKKIKILRKKPIGDIAPYKYRYRVEIKVL